MISPLGSTHSYRKRGQGALEYLLLIGGAILVVTVILLILFTSVLPVGTSILQNNLANAIPSIPPSGGGPPLSPYSGPLRMDWSTMALPDYFELQSGGTTFISTVNLTNTGNADIILTHLTPVFSFQSVQTPLSPLPSKLKTITVRDSTNAIIFSLSDILTNATVILPIPVTIQYNETWTLTLEFDAPIFPTYLSAIFIYPSESSHSIALQFTDTSNVIHRPDSLNEFLVYEKGFSAGALDSFVHTCNGRKSPPAEQQPTTGIVTDLCIDAGGLCLYVRDLGYSTAFAFPTVPFIPLTAKLFGNQFAMTQLDTVVTGSGSTAADADPYYLVRGPPSCNPVLFNSIDSTLPPASFSKTISPSNPGLPLNEVKFFDFDGVIVPGDSEVSFSLVGSDHSASYPVPGIFEGWRQWQTGFSAPSFNPGPFLVVRYALPA